MLPHESLANVVAKQGCAVGELGNLDDAPSGLKHAAEGCCATHEINPEKFIALGLHGDGVPVQVDDTASVAAWNIPGVHGAQRTMFTLVTKKHMCDCRCKGQHTLNAIMDVFKWSCISMLAGTFPGCRSDGSAWLRKWNRDREAKAGAPLGFLGALLQKRGSVCTCDCIMPHIHFL